MLIEPCLNFTEADLTMLELYRGWFKHTMLEPYRGWFKHTMLEPPGWLESESYSHTPKRIASPLNQKRIQRERDGVRDRGETVEDREGVTTNL